MSVIQEALRRKMAEQRAREEESGRPAEKPAPDAGHYAPPPLSVRPTHAPQPRARANEYAPPRREEPVRQQESTNLTIIWILVLLLALAGVAMVWIQSQREAEARRASLAVGQTLQTAQVPAAEPPPARLPAPAPAAAPAPAPVAPVQQAAPAVEAPPAAPRPAPVGMPVSPVPAPAPTQAEAPAMAPPRGPVAARQESVTRDDWPRIELVGILSGGAGRRSTAILNGSLVMVDAQIEGVTLAEVTEEGVYLEFLGDRQFIRIGEHTR